MQRIYLDNNSTTPLAPEVIRLMTDLMPRLYGNPSSIHREGQEARALLTASRDAIARHFDVRPRDIIFTSGATEALNMLLHGVFAPHFTGHLITSTAEHAAVLYAAEQLEKRGVSVTYLEPGLRGAVTAEQVLAAITANTRLIALMSVNNETGVKTDIPAIASLAENRNIPFIVDAVAEIGKEPFHFPSGVSAFCFSAHKLHAPKGVGVAIVRNALRFEPLIFGGPQENSRRAGTENLLGIAALKCALELPIVNVAPLRDHFEDLLRTALPGIEINGEGVRVSNTSNLYFPNLDGELLLTLLDMRGISASLGSACQSGAVQPSRVLLKMGYSKERARSSLRFSLSRYTTLEEVEKAASAIIDIYRSKK